MSEYLTRLANYGTRKPRYGDGEGPIDKVTVRLPAATAAEIDMLADMLHLTKTNLVAELVALGVAKLSEEIQEHPDLIERQSIAREKRFLWR